MSEHQAEAVALKAELQSLADTLRTQTEKQVTESAEEKQAISRHQARLDTLQVCCLQCHVHLTYVCAALPQMHSLCYSALRAVPDLALLYFCQLGVQDSPHCST